MPASIRSLLIANRGDPAVRVARACRDLGIRAVAVYSEADRGALHVRLADEAVAIGPADLSLSYLDAERILDAARRCKVDAVHPGWGFLSENADFAEACARAGLVFVGPTPETIRRMGDKTAARALAAREGIPVAPGGSEPVGGLDEARRLAATLGYPVLIKAAAGGGGKGMRVVQQPAELERALEMARHEAEAAFGDGRVFVEKYLAAPRHVEFQVLADAGGATVHLFERECSIQRRHQKVIEEAPSPALTPALRRQMGEAAVHAARACDYRGAGTVEFLLDADGAFYFMEMNTRLQVEHPLTEWITGLDLVAEQIRIAEGAPLGRRQEDVRRRGHAIECRVYAENSFEHFLPDPGRLQRYAPPSGPGIRVDAGVERGSDIMIHYDAMIAKVSAWAPNRETARRRMLRALAEFEVAGVHTTIPFCAFALAHDAFRSGAYATDFIARHWPPPEPPEDGRPWAAAAAVLHALRAAPGAPPEAPPVSRWAQRRRMP